MLRAYRAGLFPMAPSRTSAELEWLDPLERGIIPLEGFHLPARLARKVRNGGFTVRSDGDFAAVIAACAAPAPGRAGTWINDDIESVFNRLAALGHAHSIEVLAGGHLVGGLYGVAIGGAFFGESMFSHATDASKVALVHLVARLRLGGFVLLDTQFVTDHLAQFGSITIPREAYHHLLDIALATPARWPGDPPAERLAEEMARWRRVVSPAS
ncbi:MAG: leucyl/phenylalanyl-tRNA--protein transferase [Rhodospirillales bacterium]|nr:leucyl/phenylalanyl-tRNA--protein transferase [Rhodospirillales bacterium]